MKKIGPLTPAVKKLLKKWYGIRADHLPEHYYVLIPENWKRPKK